jgi:hypothetical protein
LAVWGVVALVGFVLIGGLLGSALSSEADVTSNPESKQAQDLIDARFPEREGLDEVVIVRSDEVTVTTTSTRAARSSSPRTPTPRFFLIEDPACPRGLQAAGEQVRYRPRPRAGS